MKQTYALLIYIIIMLPGIAALHAQVAPADFQFSSGIFDSLGAPARMAVDRNDNVFITDSYYKVIRKFDASGALVQTLSCCPSPVSVAVNSHDELFAGDGQTGLIYKICGNGTAVPFYTGTLFPTSMAFSPDGLLYVADSKLKQVIVLNNLGDPVRTIGGGTLVFPTGVAYDWKNNRVLVGEHGAVQNNLQSRVLLFNPDGTLITQIGSYGSSAGKFYRVQGITAGRCGHIYVCDPFQGNLSVFSETGAYITRFGQFGTAQGQLNMPMDVAFDSQDRVLVTSMNNGSINIYTISDPLPSASITSPYIKVCNGDTARIAIRFTGSAPWTFTYTRDDQNPVTINSVGSNPYFLGVTQPGNYKITALSDASASGYCFSGSTTVTAEPEPTARITGLNAAICEDQTAVIPVEFTGTPPWSFTYTRNGASTAMVDNISTSPYLLEASQAGTYHLLTVSGALCNGTVLPGDAQLTVNPLPTAGIPSFSDTICSGKTFFIPVQFTGAPPWTFEYTVDGAAPRTVLTASNPYNLSAFEPGIYRLTAVTDASCAGTNLTGMVQLSVLPEPVSGFTVTTFLLTAVFTNLSQNSTSWLWDFGDNSTSNLENPLHHYSQPGNYAVTLTAGNSTCRPVPVTRPVMVTTTSDIPGTPSPRILDGEATANSGSPEIFPNPSDGLFTLTLDYSGRSAAQLEVRDLEGRLVYDKRTAPGDNPGNAGRLSVSVDLRHCPAGIYTLQVKTDSETCTRKLVLNN